MRRPNSHPIVLCEEDGIGIVSAGRMLYSAKKIKLSVKDGRARLMSPIFFFLRKNSVKLMINGKETDFSFEKNMKNTNVLDFMPSFDIDEQSETDIKVIINSREYRCTK